MVGSDNQYPEISCSRDLSGYGEQPPDPQWPRYARLAVQFVINYEEGAENCVLDGDKHSETFLSEIVGARPYPDRHMSMESLYEYGSRAGFWRLYRLFTRYQLPVTVFGVALALQRNPKAVEAMLNADWEIASHAFRWIDHQFMPKEKERRQIQKAIEIHKMVTGSAPRGWYTGRDSPNTRSLLREMGCFLYDSDSYADDLPYWLPGEEELPPHLVVPYALDTNDMRFLTPQGFNCGDQFYNYLRDSFDALYEEGASSPKMLSIGLHCRITGRPGRLKSLHRFLDHILDHPDVWVCTRAEIADHWRRFHPPTNG